MRKAVYMIVGLVFTLAFASCVDEEEFSDDPRGNFEALWKIIDEHYCFFDYKNEAYGLNWNEVYAKYSKQVSDGMTDDWLFEVLGNMLGELRDGHVNMYAPFDNAHVRPVRQRQILELEGRLSRKLQRLALAPLPRH